MSESNFTRLYERREMKKERAKAGKESRGWRLEMGAKYGVWSGIYICPCARGMERKIDSVDWTGN